LKLVNNLIVFSILARIIELDSFGILSYLMMLCAVAFTILEFGHRFIVIKEITADSSLATKEYISNKVYLKTILFVLVGLLFMCFSWYKDFWDISPFVLAGFVLSAYFLSVSNLNFALFYSKSKFYLVSIILILNMLFLAMGLIAVYMLDNWIYFLIFYTLGNLGMMLLSLRFVHQNFGVDIRSYFRSYNKKSFWPELFMALPFAAIILGDIMFSSIDSFFVEQYFSQDELGIYEGLKKILLGLAILIMILGTALMPWISRSIKSGLVKSYRNIILAFLFTVLMGIVIFLVYVSFNSLIVQLVLGDNFMEITEWDTHIGLFVFSKYLMVIPTLYLTMSGLQNIRLIVIYIMAIIAWFAIYYYAIPLGMKTTFKVVTYINLSLAIIYTLIFFYYMLPSQQIKLKSINV